MADIEIIGKLRALSMNREADALMQVYLTLSSALAARNGLALAVSAALGALDRHDNAPFQCESTEGAKGASDCRKILRDALDKVQTSAAWGTDD